ncbi:MAG: malate synthase A, partial [Plesiomonas shigelloides]
MSGQHNTSAQHPLLTCTEPLTAEQQAILTPQALDFLAELVTRFAPQVPQLLAAREAFQAQIDAGALPDFLPETEHIREKAWTIRGVPADLRDRRVEITGPVERKMIINALNANVKVFMADFEDSLAPAWDKVIQGQINLRDAVDGTIEYRSEEGKSYRLNAHPAVLICRVRGFHLQEKH